MTVVTAFYETPSKHSPRDYETWISNFMILNIKCIIFIDPSCKLPSLYPENEKRKYILLPISDFETSKNWDWKFDESIDHEVRIGQNTNLYKIWNQKIFFVNRSISINPYDTNFFLWMDIGCIRTREMANTMNNHGFPDFSRLHPSKITITQIESFNPKDKQNTGVVDERFRYVVRIGGTMFGGCVDALNKFAKLHADTLNDFSVNKVFKGKDQNVYAFDVLRKPELFNVLDGQKLADNHRKVSWRVPLCENGAWFILHSVLCFEPLKIIIVGPGIMPIPPNGWGAVESLVWDYTLELRRLGHEVHIINERNPFDKLQFVKDFKPNILHVQYDDFHQFAKEACKFVPLVILTSHFGYLEQENRWGGYSWIFEGCTRDIPKNLVTFALSDGIKNIFEKRGVPRVFSVPNGAAKDRFNFKDFPEFPDRSIFLGKIDFRKRQHMFTSIPSIWFAGNHADGRFPRDHPRYLGEWTKDTLYKELTNYASMVLLSDGEADSLAIKEAIIAGLGVVISQFATANLDLSLPFITVIPEQRIGDLEFVKNEIAKNMAISIGIRQDIREYGLQNFSWEIRTQYYLQTVFHCGIDIK